MKITKGKIGYMAVILLIFGLLYLINKQSTPQFIWKSTYSRHDKQPLGAYAFDKILSSSLPDSGYIHSYKSISRLLTDGELEDRNLLIVTDYFTSPRKEIKSLLEYIEKGGKALIVAKYFEPFLRDTLRFEYDYTSGILVLADTIKGIHPFHFHTENDKSYYFPLINTDSYFKKIDTLKAVIIAENDQNQPVLIRYPLGKGELILGCNPYVFTNYGILSDEGSGFVYKSLGYLSSNSLVRTESYHAKTDKSTSSFRYLLSQRSLRWAFFLSLTVILIFIIFTAKRKQKAIPVIKDPENRLIGFVNSIAGLYLRKNDNADIVRKKYLYWAEQMRKQHGTDMINQPHNDRFYTLISSKTGYPVDRIRRLLKRLDSLGENTYISDSEMMELITEMDEIK
jgi:hypothetical protein